MKKIFMLGFLGFGGLWAGLAVPSLEAVPVMAAAEDTVIEEDWTLTQDMVIGGDLILKRGTLRLGGYNLTVMGELVQGVFLSDQAPRINIGRGETVTVYGDVLHYGGVLDVEGTLNVQGSYHQNSSGRG